MADALAEMEPLQPLPLETYPAPPPCTFDNVSVDHAGHIVHFGMGPHQHYFYRNLIILQEPDVVFERSRRCLCKVRDQTE